MSLVSFTDFYTKDEPELAEIRSVTFFCLFACFCWTEFAFPQNKKVLSFSRATVYIGSSCRNLEAKLIMNEYDNFKTPLISFPFLWLKEIPLEGSYLSSAFVLYFFLGRYFSRSAAGHVSSKPNKIHPTIVVSLCLLQTNECFINTVR